MSTDELAADLATMKALTRELGELEDALDSISDQARAISGHRENLARVSADVADLAGAVKDLNKRTDGAYGTLRDAMDRSSSVLERLDRATADLDTTSVIEKLDQRMITIGDRLSAELSARLDAAMTQFDAVLVAARDLEERARGIEQVLRVLDDQRLAATLDDGMRPLNDAVAHLKVATERTNALLTRIDTGKLGGPGPSSTMPAWVVPVLLVVLIALVIASIAIG